MVAIGALWNWTHKQNAEAFKRDVTDIVVEKLTPINSKLATLSDDVSKLQGWKDGIGQRLGNVENQQSATTKKLSLFQRSQYERDQKQKELTARYEQIESLERLQDPRRVLATIRAEIQMANESKRVLPVKDVNDYKNALRRLPASSGDYWGTVAAVVNYQSMLNQLSHEAPDPAVVAKPCISMSSSVLIGPHTVTDCVITLDSNVFKDITFKDSVVYYHGGDVALLNVLFDNCRFILDIPPNTRTPQVNLLNALLNSPDQKQVRVPAG
jgi:hypothetical protein